MDQAQAPGHDGIQCQIASSFVVRDGGKKRHGGSAGAARSVSHTGVFMCVCNVVGRAYACSVHV
jgi:hypothetical protein